MRSDTLDHPKLLRLKRALGFTLYQTVGILETLWCFTARHADDGNIGKWSDEDIEAYAEWDGEPGAMVSALVDCRFLDADKKHRLTVHDWNEHCPAFVYERQKKRTQRKKEREKRTKKQRDKQGTVPGQSGTVRDNTGTSKGQQGDCLPCSGSGGGSGGSLVVEEVVDSDSAASRQMSIIPDFPDQDRTTRKRNVWWDALVEIWSLNEDVHQKRIGKLARDFKALCSPNHTPDEINTRYLRMKSAFEKPSMWTPESLIKHWGMFGKDMPNENGNIPGVNKEFRRELERVKASEKKRMAELTPKQRKERDEWHKKKNDSPPMTEEQEKAFKKTKALLEKQFQQLRESAK